MARQQGLFRSEVVEDQRHQWMGSINLVTPLAFKWWVLLGGLFATFFIAFLAFGHYTRRETVTGKLRPVTGVITLASHISGTVTRTWVHQGELVKAGQQLVEISAQLISAHMGATHAIVSKELRVQKAQVRATLASLKPQAVAKTHGLKTHIRMLGAQIGQVDSQLALQRWQAATATTFVHKIQPIERKGIISVAKFHQYQVAALNACSQVKALERQRLTARQQRSALKVQLKQLPLQMATKVHQLREQLAQIESQLAQNAAARSTVLRAPTAGVVSTLLVKHGQTVGDGQPVLSLLPEGSKLQAQLLVPSSAIGFVAPGDLVVMRYQAYPYQKFGQQYGRVIQVSRTALSHAAAVNLLGRNEPVPLYRVLVALDRQTIDANGKAHALKPDMALRADILLDRRPLWQWLFQPLYGLHQQLTTNAGGTHT